MRKFRHREYETRVSCGGRCDEVGELAGPSTPWRTTSPNPRPGEVNSWPNISHELKTPMTTISGFAEGIPGRHHSPDREQEYLKVISSETKRLSRLVRKMLDLSRLQSTEYVTPRNSSTSRGHAPGVGEPGDQDQRQASGCGHPASG